MRDRPFRLAASVAVVTFPLLVGVGLVVFHAMTDDPLPAADDLGGEVAAARGERASSPTSAADPSVTESAVARSAPSSAGPTTVPSATPPDDAPGQVLLRVVPAVRDLRVLVDGLPYASDDSGLIRAPISGREAEVRVLGYNVSPSFQQIRFTGWADRSTATTRTVRATAGQAVELGVQVSYRITVVDGADAAAAVGLGHTIRGTVDLVHAGGSTRVTFDTPTWLEAIVAHPTGDGHLEPVPVVYRPEHGGRAATGETYTPTPEGVLQLK